MADDAGHSHASTLRVVAAATAGLVAVIGVMALAHDHSLQSSHPSGDVAPAGPRPPSSADQQILAGVGLAPSDLASGYVLSLLRQGDQLSQPTLEFCGLHFASEARREARRQVEAADPSGFSVISTEAVLYRDQPSAAEAMAEVRAIRSRCPSGAVPGAVAGQPSLVWHVHLASTTGWPEVGPLDRVALTVSVSEPGGDPLPDELVVYLRRGRLVLGIYIESPGRSVVVGASTTGATIGLFQARVAALPPADVS